VGLVEQQLTELRVVIVILLILLQLSHMVVVVESQLVLEELVGDFHQMVEVVALAVQQYQTLLVAVAVLADTAERVERVEQTLLGLLEMVVVQVVVELGQHHMQVVVVVLGCSDRGQTEVAGLRLLQEVRGLGAVMEPRL
jgi:late competence protein required for DNA uptake (superfamily II DNA/RNA helicase)